MKTTFPFSFVSQLSIPHLPFFLSSYFHLHIFVHHSFNVAHTVGDGCVWCGRWRRRRVSSARATGPGAGERVMTQHVPHIPPLARVLWHSPQVPLLSNPPRPLLHPLAAPAHSLPVYLTLVSARPSQPLSFQPHTISILHSPHDRNCFLKGHQRLKYRMMAFPQPSSPTASPCDQTLIIPLFLQCSSLSQ